MKKHRPGVYINKYEGFEAPKKEEKKPWPLPLPEGVHLGTTHLWVDNQFVPLYKCPLCAFQNIHKEVINHHIKFAFDTRHNKSGIKI
jgi:hypothetical protein